MVLCVCPHITKPLSNRLHSWCKYERNIHIRILYRLCHEIRSHSSSYLRHYFSIAIMRSKQKPIYPYAWDVVLRTASRNSLQPTKSDWLPFPSHATVYRCKRDSERVHVRGNWAKCMLQVFPYSYVDHIRCAQVVHDFIMYQKRRS